MGSRAGWSGSTRKLPARRCFSPLPDKGKPGPKAGGRSAVSTLRIPQPVSWTDLQGVVFDLDGTLARSDLDFKQIRADLGAAHDSGVLEQMTLLPDHERQRWEEILHEHESAGAERSQPYPGAHGWIDFLDRRQVPRAILTRNRVDIAEKTLDRCGLHFDVIIGRDNGPPKPDPAVIFSLADRWNCSPEQLLMVGDWLYDLQVAQKANAPMALICRGRALPFAYQADLVWTSLESGLLLTQHGLDEGNQTFQTVAVGVVCRDDQLLVGTRALDKPLAGKAEFPGGKVHSNETPAQAAQRECLEETGLSTQPIRRLYQCQHQYEFGWLDLHFFELQLETDSVQPLAPFNWVSIDQLENYDFPAANKVIIEMLMT